MYGVSRESKIPYNYIVTCRAHPVLVKKANQVGGSFHSYSLDWQWLLLLFAALGKAEPLISTPDFDLDLKAM